jgi:uncharacterized protein (TIGR02147 family)
VKEKIEATCCLYDYTDYQLYLKDYFAARKKLDSTFSFQTAAEIIGIKYKSFIHKIVNGGKKNLSQGLSFKLSQLLEHDKRESEYFHNLVCFNQTESIDEKNYYYEKLHSLIRPTRRVNLQRNQFDYFSSWYIPVLRELITMPSFDGNLSTLAKQMVPTITLKECKKGIEILKELHLIEEKSDGVFIQKDFALNGGPEIRNLAIRNFQLETLDLAKNALKNQPIAHREIGTSTFGINQDGMDSLVKLLRKQKMEIIDLISNFDENCDRVYQLNQQLFPLSKIPKNLK